MKPTARALSIACSALLPTSAEVAAQVQFEAPVTFAGPIELVLDVEAFDADGDGDSDALVRSSTSRLEWFESGGTGGTRLGRTLSGGGAILRDGRTLDLDADGLPDVVATREGVGVVAYANLGGNFGPERVLVAGPSSLRARAMIDVDLDGSADLVVLGVPGIGLAWCRATGGGSFGSPQPLWAPSVEVTEAVPADLDGDGDQDLVVYAVQPERVFGAIHAGASGTMTQVALAPAPPAFITYEYEPAVGDVNGDGRIDVVVGSNSGTVLLLNQGGLSFAPPSVVTSFGAWQSDLVDIDRDGDLDLYQGSTTLPFLALNDGFGGFSAPSNIVTGFVGYAADFGDQDGDGWLDYLSEGANFTGVNWYPHRGTAVAPFYAQPFGLDGDLRSPWRLTAFDGEGDGDVDLAVLDRGRYRVTFLGSEAGAPLEVVQSPTGSSQPVPEDIHAADLDGDGVLDLVTSAFNEIQVLLGTGDGSFQPAAPVTFTGPGVVAFGRLAAPGDIDGDGDLDLMMSIGDGSAAGPTRIVWFPGDGLGGFGAERVAVAGIPFVYQLDLVDVDGDGFLDASARLYSATSLALWRGLGGGNFGPRISLGIGEDTLDRVHEDLDGDGDLDILAIGGPFPNRLVWFPYTGTPGGAAQVLALATHAEELAVGDVDGDGLRDVIVQRRTVNGSSAYAFAVLPRLGATSFGPMVTAAAMFAEPVRWTLVDHDGDLDLDIAWSRFSPAAVGLVRNLRFGEVGLGYCDALPNSTGRAGRIAALGDRSVAAGALRLAATELPPAQTVLFLAGRARVAVFPVPGSSGRLCLGGPIGRFVGPGQVASSGPAGQTALTLDLAGLPSPTGPVGVQAGDLWTFQAWHRDSAGGGPTSNFTDAVAVVFAP